jgi:endonuclease-8
VPEGHLLHRLARDQAELVGCDVAARSPQGPFRAGAATLDGRRLLAVEAYGKHLAGVGNVLRADACPNCQSR